MPSVGTVDRNSSKLQVKFEKMDINILDSYRSLIEIIEKLVSIFASGGPKHYPAIHQELLNCCHRIDSIITWETDNNCGFIAELCQQKQQLMMLIDIIGKILQNQNVTIKRVISKPREETTDNDLKNITQTPIVNGLNEIIGLQCIKKTLKTLVILPKTQPHLFYNRRICTSILFFGPPGTGKTRLAHALAAEAHATFYSVSAGDILSHYVGQTEKNIKTLFENLKKDGEFSILFIDEIDAFCKKRTENEQEYTRRIKTELMCQMSSIKDSKNAFIVCATNCPWDLDSAILRRFQRRIYVPLPNQLERLQFFNVFARDVAVTDWNALLEKTEGYSGSDLCDLKEAAFDIPLNELEYTMVWKRSGDGFYEPVAGQEDLSGVVCCDLRELPDNSVRARKVQMFDFLNAADAVKRTVTADDVKKYEDFCG